ncbi:MAG: AraC family transcriptional regulator [Clostridia bacterium]|nr:AraC family transcriptional regulator [Clostridia bacterium]
MEWIDRLNDAMRYIETHLDQEISLDQLAKIACCSPYHFQRMFAYIADVPLSEYIRRRRMSLAAVDLRSGGEKIVDIALKYGYSSPTAFNRAFQSVHGVAPSAVRKDSAPLKSFPPIQFHVTVSGGQALEYRIEEHPAFRAIGLLAPLSTKIEENFSVVPGLWGRAAEEGIIPQLLSMMDGVPKGLLGVSACMGEDSWHYMIGVASSMPADAPFESLDVGAYTWAVFSGSGSSHSIQDLEKRVVLEWLPTSGYEYADGPDIEVYLNADPQNAHYEVWIPVTKK